MITFATTPTLIAAWTALGGLASGIVGISVQRQNAMAVRHVVLQRLATAALFALLAYRIGGHPDLLVASAFVLLGVPLALEDARTGRLPNRLMACLYGVVATAAFGAWLASMPDIPWARAIAGMLLCLLFFGSLYALWPAELGGGDVKLSAPLGLVLAWMGWPALFAGLLLGWVAAAVFHGIARLRKGQKGTQPLGPFLIGAACAVLVALP